MSSRGYPEIPETGHPAALTSRFQFNLAASPPSFKSAHKLHMARVARNHPIFIIVDTNIYLRHLTTIRQFSLDVLRSGIPFILVVPGIVIEELDRQKHRSYVARAARAASTWILRQLRSEVTILRGQKNEETAKPSKNWRLRLYQETNDDLIVDCCQFYLAYGQVILCSSDINICAKSEMEGIKTISPPSHWTVAAFRAELLRNCTLRTRADAIYKFPHLISSPVPTTSNPKHAMKQDRSQTSNASLEWKENVPLASAASVPHMESHTALEHAERCVQSPLVNPMFATSDNRNVSLQARTAAWETLMRFRWSGLIQALFFKIAHPDSPILSDSPRSSRQSSHCFPRTLYDKIKYLTELKAIPVDPTQFSILEESAASVPFNGQQKHLFLAARWEAAARGLSRLADAYGDVKLHEALATFTSDFALLFNRPLRMEKEAGVAWL